MGKGEIKLFTHDINIRLSGVSPWGHVWYKQTLEFCVAAKRNGLDVHTATRIDPLRSE